MKIKAFSGTSKNAVRIQVWTRLIAYLLLFWLKLRSTVGWDLPELTRLVQTSLIERGRLWDLLCPWGKAPPPQMFLFPVEASI